MSHIPAIGAAVADAFAVEAARLGFAVSPEPTATFEEQVTSQLFEQTGQSMGGGFYQFWRKYGGVRVFGYPVTSEMQESGITVQYTERARFEHHPENGDADNWNVELGRIGSELLADRSQNVGQVRSAIAAVRAAVNELDSILTG